MVFILTATVVAGATSFVITATTAVCMNKYTHWVNNRKRKNEKNVN